MNSEPSGCMLASVCVHACVRACVRACRLSCARFPPSLTSFLSLLSYVMCMYGALNRVRVKKKRKRKGATSQCPPLLIRACKHEQLNGRRSLPRCTSIAMVDRFSPLVVPHYAAAHTRTRIQTCTPHITQA